MSKIKVIACLGSGSGVPGEIMYDVMEEVGQLLGLANAIVATGAYGGAGMEAPAKGTQSVGGHIIGYTFVHDDIFKPNDFLTEVVRCETGCSVEVAFGTRLGHLLEADGFIIGAGGGAGTLVELMAIVNLKSKLWEKGAKKVAILRPTALQSPGWDNSMIETLKSWGTFPASMEVQICATAEEAVNAVL